MLRVDWQCCKNFLLFQQISIPAIPLDCFILGSTKRSRISIHVNGLKQTKTCIRSFWIFTLWSLLAKKKKDHESIQPILYYASPLHCYSHLLWRKRTGYKLASVRSTEPQPVGSVVDWTIKRYGSLLPLYWDPKKRSFEVYEYWALRNVLFSPGLLPGSKIEVAIIWKSNPCHFKKSEFKHTPIVIMKISFTK